MRVLVIICSCLAKTPELIAHKKVMSMLLEKYFALITSFLLRGKNMFNNPISTYFMKTITFYVDPRIINLATFVSALLKCMNPTISVLLLYLQTCRAQRRGYVTTRSGMLVRLGVLCATFIL